MAQKKSPLGRGLEALIPELDIDSPKDRVMQIDINSIEPNGDQPRKKFDQDKMQQLADSIREHGIVQPILVRKSGETYKLIAGERRWRAARIAGLDKVPAVVGDFSEREIMEISLIENIQREDLNPIEEANAYNRLIEEFNLTQEEIASRVGKSRPTITNSLRLLNLDERVQRYLMDNVISEGHARCLMSIPNAEMQYEAAKRIIDGNLNVRQAEKMVKSTFSPKKKKVAKKVQPLFIGDIQERMKDALGTKVTISYGRKKGKIEIEYYSLDDLERIADMLKA